MQLQGRRKLGRAARAGTLMPRVVLYEGIYQHDSTAIDAVVKADCESALTRPTALLVVGTSLSQEVKGARDIIRNYYKSPGLPCDLDQCQWKGMPS
jgi:NAD-dependent SIR2 family protein deacetylase